MKGGLKKTKHTDYLHRYDLERSLPDRNDIRKELVPFDDGRMYGACKLHYFDGGMLFHMNLKVRENCRPQMDNNESLIKMHFCLKGEKRAGLDDPKRVFYTQNRQNKLHYIPVAKGYFDLIAGEEAEFIDICLEETFFESVFTDYPLTFTGLSAAIGEKRFFELSEIPLFTSPKMEVVLSELLNCRNSYQSRKLYFHNKLIELMLLQFETAKHQVSCINNNFICKIPRDYEQLELAKSILLNRYDSPPSISQLSKLVGLNEFKLKKGFKEVYKNTIYGYLREYKLTVAKEMLVSQRLSVSEVCYRLGYESTAHFSRLFKSKFNINPSSLKKANLIGQIPPR